MRFNWGIAFVTGISIIVLYSCLSSEKKDERLARQACGSCHLFPEPALLSKKTWENDVFPQMAFRMGVDYSMLSDISFDDQPEVLKTLPGKSMVNQDQWESIKRYYFSNSPDSLLAPVKEITSSIRQFKPEAYTLGGFPLLTFAKADTTSGKIYVGSRLKKLYRLNDKLQLEDSFDLPSSPSYLLFRKGDDPMISLMGIMDPNDQAVGEVSRLFLDKRSGAKVLDSLKRPVHFEIADLDHDGLEDIVVCAFGNYSGALLAFRQTVRGTYQRYVLQNLPGARRVIIRDFDNNGLPDIMALMTQGSERIILLHNQGNFNFRINTLLSFPPVYGSSYFDVADFNKDGKFDILYTNGDNADYSMVPKAYHGVRVFLNSGNNDFNESWFYNMHGATQAIADDFDKDGDLDIAAIAFFPDFKKHPQQGFIYFENNGSGYTPQTTDMADKGRWLSMELLDIENDGDRDVLLVALDFNSGVPSPLLDKWKKERVSLLLMRNKGSR